MPNPKLKSDVPYLLGWFCCIFPLFGFLAASEYFVRGSRRMAFQALVSGWWPWIFLIGVDALFPKADGALVLVLVLPVITLYFLRRLEWPTPTPLKAGVWVSVVISLVIMGILAAIAIPAYRDMGVRSRSYDAIYDAEKATEWVANYYYQNRRFPDDLALTGFKAPVSKYITSLEVIDKGSVKLVMGFAPLAGKSLVFVPAMDGNNKIIWTCMSPEIKDNYLPAKCRSKTAGQIQQ